MKAANFRFTIESVYKDTTLVHLLFCNFALLIIFIIHAFCDELMKQAAMTAHLASAFVRDSC